MKRFIGWILSKVFPYRGISPYGSDNSDSVWNKRKLTESEEFYGGAINTGLRGRWKD